jgi:hypothetical protein
MAQARQGGRERLLPAGCRMRGVEESGGGLCDARERSLHPHRPTGSGDDRPPPTRLDTPRRKLLGVGRARDHDGQPRLALRPPHPRFWYVPITTASSITFPFISSRSFAFVTFPRSPSSADSAYSLK